MGPFDLEDPRLGCGHRKQPLEHLQGVVAGDRLREPHICRSAVRENERWCAEYPMLGHPVHVIRGQRVQDARISDVTPQPVNIDLRCARHVVDDVRGVDVEAISVPGAQERVMEGIEAALPARRFGGGEGEPSSHHLGRGRRPDGPAVILGVHLSEREVAPVNLYVACAGALHGVEEQRRPVHERT